MVLRLTPQKVDHFGDVFPSQSFDGTKETKPNITKASNTGIQVSTAADRPARRSASGPLCCTQM